MIKSDLVNVLVEQGGFSREQAEAVVDAMFASMRDALASGENIELRGFGAFVIRDYPAYTGRNPKTKETITVGARRGLLFRAGKELRDRVNNPPTRKRASAVSGLRTSHAPAMRATSTSTSTATSIGAASATSAPAVASNPASGPSPASGLNPAATLITKPANSEEESAA